MGDNRRLIDPFLAGLFFFFLAFLNLIFAVLEGQNLGEEINRLVVFPAVFQFEGPVIDILGPQLDAFLGLLLGVAVAGDVGEGLFRIGPPLRLFEGEGGRVEPIQTLFFDPVFDGLIESIEFRLLLAVAELVGFLEIILAVEGFRLGLKLVDMTELEILQKLVEIGLGVRRVVVEDLLEKSIRLLVIAIADQNLRALEKRRDVHVALDDGRLLFGLDFRGIPAHQLVDATEQILHEAQLGKILGLEIEHLFGQIIGIHVAIARNQVPISVRRHEGDEPRPFVLDPDRVEILGFGPHHQHDLRRIEGGEDVRLIHQADLLFQGDSREEDLVAFLRQFVIDLLGQNGILGPFAGIVRLLVANENIERIFLLRDGEDVLLDRGDLLGFGLVLLTSYHVGFGQGILVIDVLHDRLEGGPMHGRLLFLRGRVIDVLDAIPTENDAPVRLGFVGEFRQNGLIG